MNLLLKALIHRIEEAAKAMDIKNFRVDYKRNAKGELVVALLIKDDDGALSRMNGSLAGFAEDAADLLDRLRCANALVHPPGICRECLPMEVHRAHNRREPLSDLYEGQDAE